MNSKLMPIFIIIIALAFALFASGSLHSVGFVPQSVPITPVDPHPEPGYISCADVYAPACGGACTVIEQTTEPGNPYWVYHSHPGTCVLSAAGGCECKRNN